MSTIIADGDPAYGLLLQSIKDRIHSARHTAARSLNRALISLYWELGQLIVERQEALGWGESVVERLSQDLRAAFPDMTGFHHKTSGSCASFSWNTEARQISNSLLEKFPGDRTSSSCNVLNRTPRAITI